MPKTKIPNTAIRSLLTLLIFGMISCSHSFDADTLDLGMYQWNLWPDTEAVWGEENDSLSRVSGSFNPSLLPTCGWEELHRGMGKLVRIPTTISGHYPDSDGSAGEIAGFRGVAWFHCRFSLPEQWEEKPISLEFEEAGPRVEVFLNETYVGSRRGDRASFSLDVSDIIYYTRDNHLAIRIADPKGSGGGITGSIHVKPDDSSGQSE